MRIPSFWPTLYWVSFCAFFCLFLIAIRSAPFTGVSTDECRLISAIRKPTCLVIANWPAEVRTSMCVFDWTAGLFAFPNPSSALPGTRFDYLLVSCHFSLYLIFSHPLPLSLNLAIDVSISTVEGSTFLSLLPRVLGRMTFALSEVLCKRRRLAITARSVSD